MPEFKIGDEVDVRFNKSIVTGVGELLGGGGLILTVQTAGVEITFDFWADDTSVKKTGVWHDMRRCPQCSHPLKECAHRDQYDEQGVETALKTTPGGEC